MIKNIGRSTAWRGVFLISAAFWLMVAGCVASVAHAKDVWQCVEVDTDEAYLVVRMGDKIAVGQQGSEPTLGQLSDTDGDEKIYSSTSSSAEIKVSRSGDQLTVNIDNRGNRLISLLCEK